MANTLIRSYWSSGGLVFAPNQSDLTVPSVFMQVGTTDGVNLAGGVSMVYAWAKHQTTAVTGTSRALRGNAAVMVASTAGTMIGVEGRAGNGTSASAADGVSLGTAIGGYFYVAGTATATITTAIGMKAALDIDASGLTTTTGYGVLINCQTGPGTTTNLYGLSIEHEAASGTADTMTAAIRIRCVNGNEPMTVLIDASGAGGLAVHDTDQWPILKLPTAAGKILSWDVSASGWVQS